MNYVWMRDRWDRVLAVIAAVVGVIVLIIGWVGVSGSSLTTEQIPYLASGAVGGLFALGAAATLWLSADLRDEYVKLDEIYQWMQGEKDGYPPAADIDSPASWAEEPSWAEPEPPTQPEPQIQAEPRRPPSRATTTARQRPLRARPPVSSVES